MSWVQYFNYFSKVVYLFPDRIDKIQPPWKKHVDRLWILFMFPHHNIIWYELMYLLVLLHDYFRYLHGLQSKIVDLTLKVCVTAQQWLLFFH